MTVEEQLRQALAEQAAAVGRPADRWSEIEAQAASAGRTAARRRGRRNWGGLTVLGVAAAAAAALIALPALTHGSGRRVVVTPSNQPTTVVSPPPSTTASSTPGRSSVPGGPSVPPTAVVGSGFSYQLLYPFRSVQEANAWQASYLATGAQPWHLDPGRTALSFAGYLGYTDVTTVFGVRNDSTGAHVTVGFPDPNGRPVNAAVVHLRRVGAGINPPWEVVGTDDPPTFSVTSPRYGATAASPLSVGGVITGVDESIRVQVRQLSSTTPLGISCCHPAGGAGTPWTATVAFQGATDKVLIVAASTGGHLAAVERFAVTAIRTGG